MILDIPGQMIDLMLELAYFGLVGGLGLNNISQVHIFEFLPLPFRRV